MYRKKSLFVSFLTVTVLMVAAHEARADAGDLDASFDGDGVAQIDVFRYPQGTGLAVQPDGSIVVAVGSPWANVFGAMQLLPDGSPDDTFGLHGRARIDLDGRTSATDLLLQSDGKVVIVGFVRKRMLAVRFAIDGSLDATFGGNGKVAVGFPGSSGGRILRRVDARREDRPSWNRLAKPKQAQDGARPPHGAGRAGFRPSETMARSCRHSAAAFARRPKTLR